MKPIPGLDELLARAREKHIFGTKMRSVIKMPGVGLEAVVDQQFDVALQILGAGLIPIIEPEIDNLYADLVAHPNVLRVVFLSGGFSRDEANERLARNHGVVASFSRALTQGLTAQQSLSLI